MHQTSAHYAQMAKRTRDQFKEEIAHNQLIPDLERPGATHAHVSPSLAGNLAQRGEKVAAVNCQVIRQCQECAKVDATEANESLAGEARYWKIGSTRRERRRSTSRPPKRRFGSCALEAPEPLGGKLKQGTPPKRHHERAAQLLPGAMGDGVQSATAPQN